MLGEVLGAVAGTGLGESCYVVTSDLEALEVARSWGMIPVREGVDGGVNAAVRKGMRSTSEPELMVIPADLPLLSCSELEQAAALKSEGADVVISPSQALDGTNLLLFSRTAAVRLSYDVNSFWSHLEDAAKKDYSLAVYTGKGVIFDVDSASDLRRLAGANANTHSVAFAREALQQ
jgi:2-phospho-L-lactate guanylyltransferase